MYSAHEFGYYESIKYCGGAYWQNKNHTAKNCQQSNLFIQGNCFTN